MVAEREGERKKKSRPTGTACCSINCENTTLIITVNSFMSQSAVAIYDDLKEFEIISLGKETKKKKKEKKKHKS